MLKKLLKNKMVMLGAALGVGYFLYKKYKGPAKIAARYEDPISILGMRGMGDYVTQPMVGPTQQEIDMGGLGYDVARGADAFGRVGRADVAYDDTFASTQ